MYSNLRLITSIFHKERLEAIPEEEHARYMPVMIYRRLRMLRRILRCAQKDNTVEELRTSALMKRAACRYS